jgi:putative N6-adenine-specific DNA methylase
MCGAGSFSLEAAVQARNIPAGWFQDFAFFNWPAFTLTRRRWLHILSRHRQRIVDAARATIFASDIDPAACEALKKNAATSGLAATISVSQRDFFGLSPRECGPAPGLVTLNPPFGRRIGSVGQSRRLFGEIFEELNARWRGWRVGIVVPHQSLLKAVPFAAASLPVRCGGLRLFLVTGKIPP